MLRLLSKALTFAHHTKLNLRGHMTFKDLGVDPALTKVLHASIIDKPFQIQRATLLDAIAGKDILGRGPTDSGKTFAFGLALITRLAGRTAAAMRPLVKVTGTAEPSGIPVITTQGGKSDGRGRLGGYRGSRSRGGRRRKKSRPRPHERRKRPR